MSKRWSKWIKNGAAWARIRASEAHLAVYVTFYFPTNIVKNICIQSFFTTEWDIKYIHHTCSFYYCVHECNKRTYFHLSLKYMFFYIFTHIFLYPHMTQDTCKKIEQILQFSAVVRCVNQYDEFLFFNCTKNSAHLKIMVPGLRGLAGSPYKSEDITGWGLTLWVCCHRTLVYHEILQWALLW